MFVTFSDTNTGNLHTLNNPTFEKNLKCIPAAITTKMNHRNGQQAFLSRLNLHQYQY